MRTSCTQVSWSGCVKCMMHQSTIFFINLPSAALGTPIGSFEADSCAYIGKDLFYYYPGFELTVNEVEGVDRITAITVADDTVTTPQGLRIYDDEEKLLDVLGGTEENGVYTYESGKTILLIQVKAAEDGVRRIATMEYRAAEEG